MSATCEICGGTRLVKNVSGDFICQDCGAAYSVDAMRVLLTGEIIDDESPIDTPLNLSESDSEEIQLEAEVISNFELGNYQRVSSLVDEYFKEKRKILGENERIDTSKVPYAHFLGSYAESLSAMDSGKTSGYGGIAQSFGRFTEDIIASGRSGSEAVSAIAEMYSSVASELVNRTQQYVRLAQQEQDRYLAYPLSTDAFKDHLDAKTTAQGLLGQYKECGEKAILGVARISALGMDLNDESLAIISAIISVPDSESLQIPHIAAAVSYMQSIMGSGTSEKRRLFPQDLTDVDSLIQCGNYLWQNRNYALSAMSFGYARSIDENTSDAEYYCSMFRSLDSLSHSTVIADHYIDSLKKDAQKQIASVVKFDSAERIQALIATARSYAHAVIDYSKYMSHQATVHLIDGEYGAEDEAKYAEQLLHTAPDVVTKALAHAAQTIKDGFMPSKEDYKALKELIGLTAESKTATFTASSATKIIKGSFVQSQGSALDIEAIEREVREAQSAVETARSLAEDAEREKAKLGFFDRKQKQEASAKIAKLNIDLKDKEKTLHAAQEKLKQNQNRIESMWNKL